MYRLYVLTVAAMSVCFLSAIADAQAPFSGTIKLEAKAEKESVLPGEPCVLLLTLGNDGDECVRVRLGTDGIGSLAFSVARDDGKTFANRATIKPRQGASIVSVPLVQPGSSVRQRVILNRFLKTPLSEGVYTVTCRLAASGVTTQTASCTVSVVASDDRALGKIMDDLGQAVMSADDADVPAMDGVVSLGAFYMSQLCYSRSPLAVEPLRALLMNPRVLYERQSEAVQGLARIGTVNAVRVLTEISSPVPTSSTLSLGASLTQDALFALASLRDGSKDPEVVRLCKEATRGRVPVAALPAPAMAGTATTAGIRNLVLRPPLESSD